MATYKDAQGNLSYVENPDLNPGLVAGKTLVSNDFTLNSSTLAPTPSANFQQPNPTPVYPVGSMDFSLTQPEQQAQDLTSQLKSLNSQLIGQSDYRTSLEGQQDISGQTRAVTDLSSKLKSLQNEALAIPQQLQQEATGRGITTGGLQPIQTAALRNNAIQALGVNSLLEAARGNLTTSLSLIDRAVSQRFDPIKEQIAAGMANLNLILNSPEYSLAEKKRAQQQADIQAQRQRDITKQEENNKIAQAMAAAAVKNNPNNQQALLAAQQAQALNPSDPQYLQKVYQLLGAYQSDPAQTQKDLDAHLLAQSNIRHNEAEISKILGELQASKSTTATQQKTDAINLVNGLLINPITTNASGLNAFNPFNRLPGTKLSPVQNQLKQLSSMLSLDKRQLLKGSGAISDYESKTLDKAASSLGIDGSGFSNLSGDQLLTQLKQVRGALITMNGGIASVKVTDAQGNSKTVQANTDQISRMENDGLNVEYQ